MSPNGPHCQSQKPPIGLCPRTLHDERRKNEILDAIGRYRQAGYVVPVEWLDELTELHSRNK